MSEPLRIGILGAARIAPFALIKPARAEPSVLVSAVAARDQARATAFAKKHGIARVLGDYQALIGDAQIDAIYNPLPNSLHAEWTMRALAVGKHVLCEKPLTANATEAVRVAEVAKRSGRVCMEAFHWRYHPLAARAKEILDSGELGAVQRIETNLCVPIVSKKDIRFQLALGGGAVMDVGCYTISMLRFLAGAEPTVTSAQARLRSPGVDRHMHAEMSFADGRSGAITCSLWSSTLLKASYHVACERGTLDVLNPIVPQYYHRLTVRGPKGKRKERVPGAPTYLCQLRAFVGAVQRNAPVPTDVDDAVKNMTVIDAVYRAAGMTPRGLEG